jgi:hypothetical protein
MSDVIQNLFLEVFSCSGSVMKNFSNIVEGVKSLCTQRAGFKVDNELADARVAQFCNKMRSVLFVPGSSFTKKRLRSFDDDR